LGRAEPLLVLRPGEEYRLGLVDGPEAQKPDRGAREYTREDGTPLPLTPDISRRRFDYDRRLLPNPYMAVLEPQELDRPTRHQGLTIGYPAWSLLYYSLYCSLDPERDDLVVIETGTNRGLSTISMAQAVEDVGANTIVETVDVDDSKTQIARENVEGAGLTDRVKFHIEDSLEFLTRLTERVDHIDFVFLDDNHDYEHVAREIEIVHPLVVRGRGKIYFDNTTAGGVAEALRFLRRAYGGNVVEFENCSWRPPGNAIWQPD
jgi:predicted O-methyltransferase YrrM